MSRLPEAMADRDAQDLRWLVQRVCKQIDVPATALLDIDYNGLKNRDERWLRGALYEANRGLTPRVARELLARLFALCSQHGWGLGPRFVRPMIAWHGRLFGSVTAPALLLFPGPNAKLAATDLAAHIEARFEQLHDPKGRAWRQYGPTITAVFDDYFTRYERAGKRAIESANRGEVGLNHNVLELLSMLRPRCRDAHHPARVRMGMALLLGGDEERALD